MVTTEFCTQKHAIVTSGANGIGLCITERFLKAGATVYVIDIDGKAGAALQERLIELRFFCGDIAEQQDLKQFTYILG